jgi:hypothetical protein
MIVDHVAVDQQCIFQSTVEKGEKLRLWHGPLLFFVVWLHGIKHSCRLASLAMNFAMPG